MMDVFLAGTNSGVGMVSPVTGAPVTLASASQTEDAAAMFTDAFGDFLIDASPIRAANARTAMVEQAGRSSEGAE